MIEHLKQTAKDEKGAASVLIIFMLLVLVTFGVFAITSANANYKLSRKTIEWTSMYYELDAEGEDFLCALDEKLADAEASAYGYMKNKGYLFAEQPGIPEEVQTEIFSRYSNGALAANEIISKIYMYYADIFISELAPIFPELEMHYESEGVFTDRILVKINLWSKDPEYELCGLSISVWAEPLKYETTDSGGEIILTRANDDLRYKIEDWYEFQEPLRAYPEEEPSVELWDGSL